MLQRFVGSTGLWLAFATKELAASHKLPAKISAHRITRHPLQLSQATYRGLGNVVCNGKGCESDWFVSWRRIYE